MKELFIATSYHHVMVAIAKMRQNKSVMDLLISNFSTGDEYWRLLVPKLINSEWFGKVFYFDERKNHPPNPNRIIDTIKYEKFGEKAILQTIDGFNVDSYDMIYVIDDKMFPASTIIKNRRPFKLLEDTAFTYQNMEKLGTSKIMKLPYKYICKLFKILKYWHPVFGYADCCKCIETSSSDGLPEQLPKNKVVVVNRFELIESIPNDDKLRLCEIFLKEKELNALLHANNTVIIMTSLYRRGMQIEDEQIRICKKVMQMYEDSNFVIKPHPRDVTDYKKAFPKAIVLNAHFPSELLNYIDGIMLEDAVSVGSTAVNTCKYAKRTHYYTLADIGEVIPYE